MTAQRASAHWMWKWALPKGFNSKGSFNSECYPQTATLTNSCEQRCWKPQNIPASLVGQDATQICLLGSTSEQFNNLTRHFVSAAHKINFRNKRSPGRAGTAPASSLFWKLCCFPKWLQTPPTPKHTHPSILEGRGRYVWGGHAGVGPSHPSLGCYSSQLLSEADLTICQPLEQTLALTHTAQWSTAHPASLHNSRYTTVLLSNTLDRASCWQWSHQDRGMRSKEECMKIEKCIWTKKHNTHIMYRDRKTDR